MTMKGRKIIIGSQLFIIVAFFTGMMLNYYTLTPLVDYGETYRLMMAIDNYRLCFYEENGCDAHDPAQRDSVMSLGLDPFGGDVILADSIGVIFYAKDGETGNISEVLMSKYGPLAADMVAAEYADPSAPTDDSRMEYDKKKKYSFYTKFSEREDMLFFYAADYRVAGSECLRSFFYLLFFMVAGGLVIMIICFLVTRKLFSQSQKELLVRQELDTAARIQKSMLPRGEKHFMHIDVNARLIPARKVGGDFYCYLLRKGILYFIIGDVSGKGIPASIFMSKAVTLFRSHANADKSASAIAESMNEELCINNDSNMFLTAVIGTMNAYDGRVRFVNAGHEPPVVWDGKEASKLFFLRTESDIPLGLEPDARFVEKDYELDRDGLLLLYTDGVNEAKSASGRYLGQRKLLEGLEAFKSRESREINDAIIELITRFEVGTEQSDDITLLTFRATPKPVELTIRNDVKELRKIVPYLDAILSESPLDSRERTLVRSGLDEALTNCVLYAYDSPGNEIKATASIVRGALCFTIRDGGKPFNPLEYSPEPAEELRVGGLGIKMIKTVFDEVRYSREDNMNILELIKKL